MRMRWISFLVLAFTGCLAAMMVFHWREVRAIDERVAVDRIQAEKEVKISGLVVELEKYRRKSAYFRNTSEGDIQEAKSRLRSSIQEGLAQLSRSSSSDAERKLVDQASTQFSEFLTLAAKLEPMLYARDVFVKEPARSAHEQIIRTLNQLQERTKQRAYRQPVSTPEAAWDAMQPLAIAAAAALVIFLSVLGWIYLSSTRPLQLLARRSRSLEDGEKLPEKRKRLPGLYNELESLIQRQAETVQVQRHDRQQFITAVASDLRDPIRILKTNAELLANGFQELDETARMYASQAIRQAEYRLTRAWEDLTDILDGDNTKIRLNDNLIELNGFLHQVGDGLGISKVINSSMPIWMNLDRDRMERVMSNLVGKLKSLGVSERSVKIEVVPNFLEREGGVQIRVSESQPEGLAAGGYTGGPEQELLSHWASENGFRMRLVSRVIRAHGGQIHASGLVGGKLSFSIRLPQERIVSKTNVAQELRLARGLMKTDLGDITGKLPSLPDAVFSS